MTDSPNPYEPPAFAPETLAGPYIFEGVPVHAHCSRRSWFGRTIELTGGIVAEVRYDAAGIGEKVFINDVQVATSSPWHWSVVAPRIDFEINRGGHSLPATVQVHAAWVQLLRIVRFSLILDGTLVYDEPNGASGPICRKTGSGGGIV